MVFEKHSKDKTHIRAFSLQNVFSSNGIKSISKSNTPVLLPFGVARLSSFGVTSHTQRPQKHQVSTEDRIVIVTSDAAPSSLPREILQCSIKRSTAEIESNVDILQNMLSIPHLFTPCCWYTEGRPMLYRKVISDEPWKRSIPAPIFSYNDNFDHPPAGIRFDATAGVMVGVVGGTDEDEFEICAAWFANLDTE